MFKISLFENAVDELEAVHMYIKLFLDWVGDLRFIFITAHRRENLGEPIIICSGRFVVCWTRSGGEGHLSDSYEPSCQEGSR